jgi:hypothetical protein
MKRDWGRHTPSLKRDNAVLLVPGFCQLVYKVDAFFIRFLSLSLLLQLRNQLKIMSFYPPHSVQPLQWSIALEERSAAAIMLQCKQ